MFSKACLSAALLAVTGLAQVSPTPTPTPIWRPRRAYCHMKYDPANPTTFPYGRFYLYQQNPLTPVLIKGKMK